VDLKIGLMEKIIYRDGTGMFQTRQFDYEITQKDIPEEHVKEATLKLRLQAKKYILNTLILEKLRTPEEALAELALYKADLEKFEAKNV
jgi:predicted hydrolase (HD superfamily)